ncbi:MAG TPA: hypothetical protein VHB79_19925 [Polyangiaceae bacterium]|nr:hypothetical protein [Polyangiaceae bacterium]
MRLGLALVAGGLVASCLQQSVKSPTQSGEPWVELKSDHFRVSSDIGEDEAARVLASFEETYGLLGRVVFGADAELPSFTTDAIIFQHHEDMNEFVGQGFGGVYTTSLPNDVEPSPTVIASGTLSPFARLLFAHELTHRFNHVALGPTPTWLNEGLADYYSTIRGEHAQPVVGEIDPRYMCTPDGLGDLECYQYEKLPGNRLPRASEIVQLDHQSFYGTQSVESGVPSFEQKRARTQNYGVAWLLVHMLMNGKQSYAQEFQLAMVMPPSQKKGAALAAIVGRVPAAQLDADFQQYLKKGMPWRQHHAPTPPLPAHIERHSLTDGEVLVLWARLDDWNGKSARRALQRLQQANDLRATSAAFWLGRYNQIHQNSDRAKELYQRALDLEPENAEYLYGLLNLYWSSQSGMSWVEAARSVMVGQTIQALSKSAHSGSQLNAVAAYQLFSNDVPSALATSQKACESAPDCWPCFHNRAAALYASGERGDALQAEHEALSRMPEDAAFKMVELVSSAIRYYELAERDPKAVAGKPSPGLLAP